MSPRHLLRKRALAKRRQERGSCSCGGAWINAESMAVPLRLVCQVCGQPKPAPVFQPGSPEWELDQAAKFFEPQSGNPSIDLICRPALELPQASPADTIKIV